jgi:hypothetical protein
VRKSKYAGIAAASTREPMPTAGVYRFEIVEVRDNPAPAPGRNDTFKTKLRILSIGSGGEGHKVGDVVAMIQLTSGSGAQSGLSRVKSFFIAAAGFESEEDYDAFDPEGLFIGHCCGEANGFPQAELTVVGRYVDCRVERGKPTKKDPEDYYREYSWFAVADEEQPGASA